MTLFDNIPNFIRWILFIPVFFLLLLFLPYLMTYTLGYAIDPNMDDILSFLLLTPYYSGVVPGLSLFISCAMLPKGRVIYASIILGIFVFVNGMGFYRVLVEGINITIWRLFYEYIFLLGAYIVTIILVIHEKKEDI